MLREEIQTRTPTGSDGAASDEDAAAAAIAAALSAAATASLLGISLQAASGNSGQSSSTSRIPVIDTNDPRTTSRPQQEASDILQQQWNAQSQAAWSQQRDASSPSSPMTSRTGEGGTRMLSHDHLSSFRRRSGEEAPSLDSGDRAQFADAIRSTPHQQQHQHLEPQSQPHSHAQTQPSTPFMSRPSSTRVSMQGGSPDFPPISAQHSGDLDSAVASRRASGTQSHDHSQQHPHDEVIHYVHRTNHHQHTSSLDTWQQQDHLSQLQRDGQQEPQSASHQDLDHHHSSRHEEREFDVNCKEQEDSKLVFNLRFTEPEGG